MKSREAARFVGFSLLYPNQPEPLTPKLVTIPGLPLSEVGPPVLNVLALHKNLFYYHPRVEIEGYAW